MSQDYNNLLNDISGHNFSTSGHNFSNDNKNDNDNDCDLYMSTIGTLSGIFISFDIIQS